MSAQSYSWSACSRICRKRNVDEPGLPTERQWCVMKPEIDRRAFLKRMGQAGGLIVAGGTLASFLAACGGNVSTGGGTTPTPGVTPIGNAGLKSPGVLQWGSDYVSGAPYVF